MKQLLLLLFFYFSFLTFSQISFNSETKNNEIKIGDYIKVNFTLNIKNENIKTIYDPIILPDFKGFHIINSNISEHTNIINGQTSVTLIYEITLEVIKEGVLKINPAKIKINEKLYQTQPLIFKVFRKKLNQKEKTKLKKTSNKESFIEFEIEKKKLYINQYSLCEINFYTKNYNLINEITEFKIPNLKGCNVIPIEGSKKIEKIKKFGNIYLKINLHKFLLCPLIIGEIIIPEYNISFTESDHFLNEKKNHLKSIPTKIQVKKFPKNPPKNFTGAIGLFDINLITDKPLSKINSVTKIAVEVTGSGNFSFIKTPDIIIPKHFEIYNENYQDNYQITEEGLKGKIINSKIIVPKHKGIYKIKTESFVFFNPIKEQYETIEPKYLTIQVEKNYSIKNNNLIKKEKNSTNINIVQFSKSQYTYITLLIILILIIILFIFNKKRIPKKTVINIKSINKKIHYKNSKNFILINKLNSQKIKLLIEKNHKKEYFHEIENILFQIIENKNNNLKINEIEKVIMKKFGKEKFNLWKKLIIQCQIEKFNPINNNLNLYEIHNNIKNLINKLIKSL